LDAAFIGYMAHQAVQSVDFSNQMAFAEAADGRIAGHGADGGESVRHERRFGAHTSTCGRGFTAGMAAANHDNVESSLHFRLGCELVAEAGAGVKNSPFGGMFHVKHRPDGYQHTQELDVLRPELT
jgi:hypothetical protein